MNNKIYLIYLILIFLVSIPLYDFANTKIMSLRNTDENLGMYFTLGFITTFIMAFVPFYIIYEFRKVFNLRKKKDLVIKSETLEISKVIIYGIIILLLLEQFKYPFKISIIFKNLFS